MRSVITVAFAALLLNAAILPASGQFRFEGHWEGAMVRSGFVRVVRVELIASGNELSAVVFTPDEPGERRTLEPAARVEGGIVLGLPDLDSVTLQVDTTLLELRATVRRDGEETLVHLKRVAAPVPMPTPIAEDLVIENGGVRIAGTLTLPPTPGPHPVMIWIHGRGGTTRPRTRLIEYLARHGVGSFAYDQRGSGNSTGDAAAYTTADLTADAIAMVRTLARHPDVDAARIGLHARSAGNWIAPRVALEAPAAFVIGIVGPAESVFDQQLHVRELMLRTSPRNLPESEITKAMDYVRTRLTAVLRGGPHVEHLRAAETLRGTHSGEAVLLSADGEARDTSWLRRNDADPGPDLRRLTVPYLAIFGGADWIVPAERNARLLREHLAVAGNDDVTIVVIPRADHDLSIPASGTPWQDASDGGFERMSPIYVETMVRWLTARLAPTR